MTNRKSILLVEDDKVIRETTKVILETRYNVSDARNYSEAKYKVRDHIDLAIVDYVLPDHDGFFLLKEIRKIKPSLPVIMMTGYGTETVAIEAFRTGATDYIKKPLDIPYVMNKISELLGENDGGINCDSRIDAAKNRDEYIIDVIAAYIEERFREDFTRDKLAGMAKMDKYKFCRAFQNRIGQGFISYLNSIRTKNAVKLLENPDLPITEIAGRVGYRNVIHFERVFKGKYGISPREYRKNLSNTR